MKIIHSISPAVRTVRPIFAQQDLRQKMLLAFLVFACLFSGKIQAQSTVVTLGSGTQTSQPSMVSGTDRLGPVSRFRPNMRYQVVYTASELIAAGAPAGGGFISGFGWRNAVVPPGLNNYKVRMLNTTAADNAAFIAGPYTEVYTTGAYAPATEYDVFTLDGLGFYWDGVHNLLVDICTDGNGAGVPYGTSYVYAATSGSRYAANTYGDLCFDSYLNSVNYLSTWKPQARLVFTQPVVPYLAAGPLPGFGSICPQATSAPQSFPLNGGNLTGGVTVGPLTNYTFSATQNGTYTSSLLLNPTAGSLAATVYVKLTAPGTSIYNGNIPVSGGSATPLAIAATGSGFNSGPALSANGTAGTISNTGAIISGSVVSYLGCANSLSDYGIVYGPESGFAGAGGTHISGSGFGGNAGDNFTTTLSGLQPGTTYYYRAYARMAGAAGVTTYFNPTYSFSTGYPPVTTYPFYEGFNANSMPQGFNVSEGDPNAEWHWYVVAADATYGAGTPQEGARFLTLEYRYATPFYNPYYLTTRTFVLPAVPKRMRFYLWMGANSGPNNLVMQASTNGGNTWTDLATYGANPANTASTAAWEEKIIDLTAYASQAVVFRLKGSSPNIGLTGSCNIGFDNFNVENIPTPLPVQLESFTALNNGAVNDIAWTTADETGFDHFELERSAEGRVYTRIASVASGPNATGYTYRYQDAAPLAGKNYYRLKLIDRDGAYAYSAIALAVTGDKKDFGIRAFPNPTRNRISLKAEGAAAGKASVQIKDVNGRVLEEFLMNAGGEVSVDLSRYAPGTYFVRYFDSKRSEVITITKE